MDARAVVAHAGHERRPVKADMHLDARRRRVALGVGQRLAEDAQDVDGDVARRMLGDVCGDDAVDTRQARSVEIDELRDQRREGLVAGLVQAQVLDRRPYLLADAREPRHELVVDTADPRRGVRRAGEDEPELLQRLVVQRPSQAPALRLADVAEALRQLRALDRAVQHVGDRAQEVDLVGVEAPLLA